MGDFVNSMKDVLFLARQRSGSTALSYLLSDNGLATARESMTGRKPWRPDDDLQFRFVCFCELENINASRMVEDPDGLLDDYYAYLRKFYDNERVAIAIKTNHLYHIPGRSYISPYRPAMVRHSLSRKLPVVLLKRRDLFRQYLSTLFAVETGHFHQPVDSSSTIGRFSERKPLNGRQIIVDVKKTERAMNDSVAIYDLIANWYRGYAGYQEIVYEDIFDQHKGGVTQAGITKLEQVFGLKITHTRLQTEKLQKDYKQDIGNIDEVLEYFGKTKFESLVVGVLGTASSESSA